jgi:hypothetical protein
MSMSISAADSALLATKAYDQRRQAMRAMEQNVASGNITAAQQSLAIFQPNSQPPSGTNATGGVPLRADWTNLVSAVRSGDLTSAQTALQKLKTDRGTELAQLNGALAPSATPSTTPSATASAGGSGSPVNDVLSLLSNTVSGNLSGAQTAANSLLQDIEASLGGLGGSSPTGNKLV